MKLDIDHFHDQCQAYQEAIELYVEFIYLLVLMFYRASAHLRMRDRVHLFLQQNLIRFAFEFSKDFELKLQSCFEIIICSLRICEIRDDCKVAARKKKNAHRVR